MLGDESVLVDGLSIIQCNGFGHGLHYFMADKGVAMCTKFNDFSVNCVSKIWEIICTAASSVLDWSYLEYHPM